MAMIRIFMACMMITILPMAVGSLFLSLKEGGARWLFAWVYGQICLWAGFLFTCIPAILLKKKLAEVEDA